MGTITLPNNPDEIQNERVTDATKVMENFTAIVSECNGNLSAANLAALAVETAKIANLAVTAAKLAADAVETLKIKDLNVTAGKLAADAVETAKIKDNNVTLAKLALTDFIETLLDDEDAAAACVTLNAVNKTEDDLDDISDGTTYKKVADVDANGHPSKVDDAVELQAAVTRYLSISLFAGEHNGGASTNFLGNRLIITDNEDIYLSVNLPHGATVTELYSSADAGAGTASLATHLKRSPLNAVTDETLASCVHTATEGEVTDSSIDDAIIDNNTYTYFTHISHTLHDTDAVVEGIRIKYTITKPLP